MKDLVDPLKSFGDYVMEEIGTLGCFFSSRHCGKSLNSPFGYGAVWLTLNLPITLARRPLPAKAENLR